MPDIPEWMGPIPTLSNHVGNDSYVVISPEGTRSPFVAHFDSKGTVRTFNPNLGVNFPPFSVGDAVVIGEVLESIPYAYDIFFDGSENFGPVQRILLLKKMGFLILDHYFDATQGFPSTYYSLGRRAYVNVDPLKGAELIEPVFSTSTVGIGPKHYTPPPIQPYTTSKAHIFYEEALRMGAEYLKDTKFDTKWLAIPSGPDEFSKNLKIKGREVDSILLDELSNHVYPAQYSTFAPWKEKK